MSSDRDLITLPELATLAGVNARTLQSWLKQGVLLPSVQVSTGKGVPNLFDDVAQVDHLFRQLRAHGKPTKNPSYNDEGYDLPGGGFVGRRISDPHGPTLDVNVPGIDDIFKVHVGH